MASHTVNGEPSVPLQSTHEIRLSTMTVDQLKKACKMLSLTTRGYKNDLIERIKQRHSVDNDRTARVLLSIVQPAPVQTSYVGYEHLLDESLLPIQYHQAFQTVAPRLPTTTSAAAVPPPLSREAQLAMNPKAIEDLELSSHLGLVEGCRVIGLTCVERRFPHSNKYVTKAVSEEERLGLHEKRYKMVVRFLIFVPETNTWTFTPIWPKETKLVMGNEVVFDTFTKNRLGMTTVGFKEPAPAVEITDKFLALQSVGPLSFEVSVQQVATGRKWLVCTSILKKKAHTALVSEILQKSPTVSQCTQRVRAYFTSGDDAFGIQHMEISLKDPASLQPISIAARGVTCLHLQCFDLFTFLDMHDQARQPSWSCPTCGTKTLVKDIVTDSWFQTIVDARVKSAQASKSMRAKVLGDGRFELLVEEDDDDFSDEDDFIPAPQSHHPISSNSISAATNGQQKTQHMQSGVPPLQTVPAVMRPQKRGKSKADAIELLDDDDILY